MKIGRDFFIEYFGYLKKKNPLLHNFLLAIIDKQDSRKIVRIKVKIAKYQFSSDITIKRIIQNFGKKSSNDRIASYSSLRAEYFSNSYLSISYLLNKYEIELLEGNVSVFFEDAVRVTSIPYLRETYEKSHFLNGTIQEKKDYLEIMGLILEYHYVPFNDINNLFLDKIRPLHW
jgi:hypothetical protein